MLTEAFMYRHNPQTAKLVELVRGGAVGEVRVVRAAFSFTITDEANIRLAADLEGGALMDVGCYCVSGSRLIAGEPRRVYGTGIWERGVDTVFTGTLEFAGDVIAQFDCGFRLPDRDELEVVGSEGSIFLDDPWHSHAGDRGSPGGRRRADRARARRLVPAGAREPRGRDPREGELLLGREDAVNQARAIDALYRSADSGAAVTF